MNYQDTLDYINSVRRNVWKLGLSRTRELLRMLGDPQDSMKFVHIGGTNGKGSMSAMTESVLRAAGYRTGLFPSPYIEDFRERICVSGVKISEEDLCRITERVKACADTMEDEPSHFEIVTAIGMVYFKEKGCDIVVLEVGLGGEFDATNVIKAPEAAVLTNIGLDHTDYLGNTLTEIARTKAGIIKSGSTVVVYPNVPEVMDVLTEICSERGCEMRIVDFGRVTQTSVDLGGQLLKWRSNKTEIAGKNQKNRDVIPGEAKELIFELPLIGEYQIRNAAMALTVVELLVEKGWNISDADIIKGMENVNWPARFELLGEDPVFILDGGHNAQCAEAVAESLKKYLPDIKLTLLIGMLRDKDYESAIKVLLPFADKCYCLTPASERALPAEELADTIRSKGVSAESMPDAEAAVARCLHEGNPVLAIGSLYMAGEVRKAHRKLIKKRLREAAIKARESLSEGERIRLSDEVCRRITETPEYKEAKTIFIYKWTRGEVRLDALERAAAADGKRLAYPKCINKTEMLAVVPGSGDDAWADSGFCGIKEPNPENGEVVEPEDIDLVIAPCTSFDENCNRLGMGGGFYDRYLPRCINAKVFAAAFEIQRSEKIPTDEYDWSADAVVTENRILCRQ